MLLAWHTKFEKHTALKKELMPVAWHPNRWWDWYFPEDEKKNRTDFSE